MGLQRMTDRRDIIVLEAAVEQLRAIDALFDDLDVGVCALHLEACLAALESRLRKANSGELPIRRLVRDASIQAAQLRT